jgi:hypothetical protein
VASAVGLGGAVPEGLARGVPLPHALASALPEARSEGDAVGEGDTVAVGAASDAVAPPEGVGAGEPEGAPLGVAVGKGVRVAAAPDAECEALACCDGVAACEAGALALPSALPVTAASPPVPDGGALTEGAAAVNEGPPEGVSEGEASPEGDALPVGEGAAESEGGALSAALSEAWPEALRAPLALLLGLPLATWVRDASGEALCRAGEALCAPLTPAERDADPLTEGEALKEAAALAAPDAEGGGDAVAAPVGDPLSVAVCEPVVEGERLSASVRLPRGEAEGLPLPRAEAVPAATLAEALAEAPKESVPSTAVGEREAHDVAEGVVVPL